MPPSQQAKRRLRRKKRRGGSFFENKAIALPFFVMGSILGLAFLGLLYQFFADSTRTVNGVQSPSLIRSASSKSLAKTTILNRPMPPLLPIFSPVPNAEQVIEETLSGKPSLAGIVAIMQKFMFDLHMANQRMSSSKAQPREIIKTVFDLTKQQLGAFDEVYRNRLIFPVREDDSIFLSLAAYREHLLNDTMAFAFDSAKNPEKLFVGAVVQNCFGRVLEDGVTIDGSGLPCKRYVKGDQCGEMLRILYPMTD